MEVFLTILRYAAGPVLGAVIGYFTNWLAVKMLFRPRYPKKIGKWQLPFTPGIIPKRKPALAKAVGKAVGEQLLTKEDFTAAVVSDSAKQRVADYAVNLWKGLGDKTAAEALNGVIPAEQQQNIMNTAEGFIADKIYSAVTGFNLGGVVAEEGVKVINQKKASLGMLSMFLSDGLISSLMEKLADGVNGYVEANGKRLISNAVKTEIDKAINSPLTVLSEKVEESTVKSIACTVYEVMVKSVFAELLESLDISGIVEQKINEMDIKDLEKLVLSVMKKELNAIVNLGALIGFILGIVMIFV